MIFGKFDGPLDTQEVVIGATDVLTGVTAANTIDVEGTINQTVTNRTTIILCSKGKVTSDFIYQDVQIDRGGQVHGKMVQK